MKERLLLLAEQIIAKLPVMIRPAAQVQFQRYSDKLTDEAAATFVAYVRRQLDYIENGGEMPQPKT